MLVLIDLIPMFLNFLSFLVCPVGWEPISLMKYDCILRFWIVSGHRAVVSGRCVPGSRLSGREWQRFRNQGNLKRPSNTRVSGEWPGDHWVLSGETVTGWRGPGTQTDEGRGPSQVTLIASRESLAFCKQYPVRKSTTRNAMGAAIIQAFLVCLQVTV